MMTDKEFNLSKIIMSAGASKASPEVIAFANDLDLLSKGIEERFEELSDSIDKTVKYLDVTQYQLTRNDVFQLRNTLKQLEHNLTILKANFNNFQTYKVKKLLNLLDKQARFKIAKGYEIIKKFAEHGSLTVDAYKNIVKKYEAIDKKLGQEIIDCLDGQFSKQEYHTLLDKYDDKENNSVGKQFVKTTMLVMALSNNIT